MNIKQSLSDWLAYGERGLSSNAIAFVALGHEPKGQLLKHPFDVADLRRCLILLEKVPECREAVGVLAKASPQWAMLWGIWDALASNLREEIGADLPAMGMAPKTYGMMRAALRKAGP